MDQPLPLYPARPAAALAGMTYRQLDSWLSAGHVTVAVPADGSGSRRLLAPDDVARLCRIQQLRAMGIELRVALDPPAAIAALVDESDVDATVAALQHLPVHAYLVDGHVLEPAGAAEVADA